MVQQIRKPKIDGRTRVDFREIARDIVAKDRLDRKYGRSVDTAGAISRAMENAYRRGFLEALSPAESSNAGVEGLPALEWEMIPPRPRNALWRICFACFGYGDREPRNVSLAKALNKLGIVAWCLIEQNSQSDYSVSDRTINPLVRLDLLAARENGALAITERGRLTWLRYVESGRLNVPLID